MQLLRRLATILIFVFGIIAGAATTLALFFARMLVRPPRQRLWITPDHYGLSYEDVHFPARDGLRLSGWFIPRNKENENSPITTVVFVHGWPWNRLGTNAENIFVDLPGARHVNLLELAVPLHRAGYQLLLFDLRNHGKSASSRPYTFGFSEAKDLLGALDYLAGRDDVDADRIGAVGFSSGANTLLFALPQTGQIKAALAVQPTSPNVFGRRFAASLSGPLGKIAYPLTELFYRLSGGMPFNAVEPLFSVTGIGATPVMYLQGSGDAWGSVGNVNQMVANTPNVTEFLIVDTSDRFGGYKYVTDNPQVVDDFFRKNIPI